MKINLAENMLRFGVKNLNKTATGNIKTLAEQGAAMTTQNRPRIASSIYSVKQLSNPADAFQGNVYFTIAKGKSLFLSKSTTFIKNVFGSGRTLLSLDLYDAIGTNDTDIKPTKHYGLVLRYTMDSQVNYAMDKSTDNTVAATNQLNKTFDESYFPLFTLDPDIAGAMTSENMALLITKAFIKYIRLGKGYEGVYKAGINAVMQNLSRQTGLLTTPWDENAVNKLRTAIEKDPELTNASSNLINALNV